MENYELRHHGIKGMKWGVRRYQNPDGTLTAAGKKRVSKEYKKTSVKATTTLAKNQQRMYVKAYNEAADHMNRGGIEKFNQAQRKKYGENYSQRDGYVDDYNHEFNKVFAKYWNKSLNDFYTNDAGIQKARDLVKKYDMTKWDDLAKQNEAAIKEVRQAVESYDD